MCHLARTHKNLLNLRVKLLLRYQVVIRVTLFLYRFIINITLINYAPIKRCHFNSCTKNYEKFYVTGLIAKFSRK